MKFDETNFLFSLMEKRSVNICSKRNYKAFNGEPTLLVYCLLPQHFTTRYRTSQHVTERHNTLQNVTKQLLQSIIDFGHTQNNASHFKTCQK